MSLEDLDFDFQSDDSDGEDEKELELFGENDDGEVLNFLELVRLHNNLMCFDHIYSNNALIDMEYMEMETSYGFDSEDLDLALIHDLFSTIPSTTFSAALHEDWSSPDSEDLAQSIMLDRLHPLYEEVASTSSSCPSDSSDVDEYEQMTNADDTNTLQDVDAGGWL